MCWVLLCLAACSYSPTRSGAGVDSNGGGDDDAPAGAFCFGQFARVCLDTLPVGPFELGNGNNTLFTDMPDMCAATTSESTVVGCVVVGTSVTIDGTLTAVGARPLIVLATEGAIEIPATRLLDVASHRSAGMRGAGANPLGLCLGQTAATGSGGGAGGSFGGLGGQGGTGNNAGAGLAAPITDATTPLRGGCGGGAGGTQTGSMDGGDGGGALLLIATSITVAGTINASGEGGLGGSGTNSIPRGGAGGGSGGMIVFDTEVLGISASGVVMAQGGGGGESSVLAISGNGGGDPDVTMAGQPAAGGGGAASTAQDGGDGGTTGNGMAGANGVTTNGGGGGGGTGIIKSLASQSQIAGTVVPAL